MRIILKVKNTHLEQIDIPLKIKEMRREELIVLKGSDSIVLDHYLSDVNMKRYLQPNLTLKKKGDSIYVLFFLNKTHQ